MTEIVKGQLYRVEPDGDTWDNRICEVIVVGRKCAVKFVDTGEEQRIYREWLMPLPPLEQLAATSEPGNYSGRYA